MTNLRSPISVSDAELINLRMSSLGLNVPARESDGTHAFAHVDRMFAIQGQDLPGALWSIANRTALADRADVERWFGSGDLVRSWPFRGTLHVMTARNAGLIMNYMAPRRARTMTKWQAETELTQPVVAQARGILREALGASAGAGAGAGLARAQISALFESEGLVFPQHRYNNLVFQANLYGDVVWGPIVGSEQLLVAAPWRVNPDLAPSFSEAEAEVEIVRGFVRGRGPVSISDVCYWTGLGKTLVSRAVESLAKDLVALDWQGSGSSLFMLADDYESARGHSYPKALLNAGFDEFLLGYKERTPQLPAGRIDDVVPGKNGMFKASVVYRGKVVGTWSRAQRTGSVDVVVTLFDGRPPSQALVASLNAPAKRLARFYGQPVNVSFK